MQISSASRESSSSPARKPISPTERWASFAATLAFDDLPSVLVERAKGLVLDTLGCALAASTLGDGCAEVRALVRADPGTPECSVLGCGERASALQAAFVNGALAHALNYDANGAAGGHLGLAAVVAPLAIAERRGAINGREFLVAVALAAELTARLGAALSEADVDANEKFLEGQLLGYFGAALAAARLAGCDAVQLHSALGLALMQAAGSRQISLEGRPAKAIYGAYTNHGAVLAALLAARGLDARCAAFEGPAGLFELFYDGRHSPGALADALGQRYRAEAVVFKPWPTSEILHPFIRAALALELDPRQIARVRVHAGAHARAWLEPVAERRRPQHAATAANSIFFGVAKCLTQRALGLADFSAAGIADPETLALAERIDYLISSQADTEARIEVTMLNGSTRESRATGATDVLGFDALATKFRDCARYAAHVPRAPERVIERVIECVHTLERVTDMRALVRMLGGD